jgi:rhodanese-related sulfurtransferase
MAERVPSISPARLQEKLLSSEQFALVDVREIKPYSLGHILYAVSLPLARLEETVIDLVPRKSLPLVVCDGGEEDSDNPGLAERAARRLQQLGYTGALVLSGGVPAWHRQGYEVFAGMNVPSKAFGEFVEEHDATPSISADELKRMQDENADFVLLDSRPMAEFNMLALPGGICCPGGELAYRAHDLVNSPDTTVVVNCAGRTRSIIGCQSLINAALPNKVYALRNGVMGWHLAGHEIAFGRTEAAALPSDEGLASAKQAAAAVAQRFELQTVDAATLAQWRAERESQALYVLDVRSAQEFEACRLIDAVHAPGGQLVQNTDFYVAIRHARLVLVDNDGVRATFAASWLKQMGQSQVHIFSGDWSEQQTTSGVRDKPIAGLDDVTARECSAVEVQQLLAAGNTQVLDVSLSNEYSMWRIPGAWFVPRARLAAAMREIGSAATLVLTSADGVRATLTAPELTALGNARVVVLAGGNKAWADAGFEVEEGEGRLALKPDDQWQIPFLPDPESGKSAEDNMREYLSWEVELINQIKRDGTTNFRHFSALGDAPG